MEGRREKRGLDSRSRVVLLWWCTEKQGNETMCDRTEDALGTRDSEYQPTIDTERRMAGKWREIARETIMYTKHTWTLLQFMHCTPQSVAFVWNAVGGH